MNLQGIAIILCVSSVALSAPGAGGYGGGQGGGGGGHGGGGGGYGQQQVKLILRSF